MSIKIFLILIFFSGTSIANEVPQKIKDQILKYGIKTPFRGNVSYSNSKIDNWFRLKTSTGVYRYDRVKRELVKEQAIIKEQI